MFRFPVYGQQPYGQPQAGNGAFLGPSDVGGQRIQVQNNLAVNPGVHSPLIGLNPIMTGPSLPTLSPAPPNTVYPSGWFPGAPLQGLLQHGQQVPRIRNMIRVGLPDDTTVFVDQVQMHQHLPRTRLVGNRRQFIVETFLDEELLYGNPTQGLVFETVRTLFRKLEESSAARQAGLPFSPDLFNRPSLLIENALAEPGMVGRCYDYVNILLALLDNDRGFGCSDVLADHVAEYLERTFPLVHAALGGESAVVLFLAYGKIFKMSSVTALERLRNIWERLGVDTQEAVVRVLRDKLPDAGLESNVARLWAGLDAIGATAVPLTYQS